MLKELKQHLRKLNLKRLKIRYAMQGAVCNAVAKKYGVASDHFKKYYQRGLDTFGKMIDVQDAIIAHKANCYLRDAERNKRDLNDLIEASK